MQPWTKKKKKKKMFNRLKQVMDKCAWYALILKKTKRKGVHESDKSSTLWVHLRFSMFILF